MKNPKRTIAEIKLLSTHFGNVCYDPANPSVVLVEHFDLPRGYNKRYCDLLIDLEPKYPELPPKDFYLSRGLEKDGLVPSHYFKDFPGKKYCREGFAWYSLHIRKWKPNPRSMIRGDNLLTAVQALYEALKTD